MKQWVCTTAGVIGSVLASFVGGWDNGLITLLFFMATDYLTGLIVAGFFQQSTKTKGGGLSSLAGWKGLCRKCVTFLFVIIAHRLDLMIDTTYIRDAVIIGFCANELISITENAGLMGIPLPEPIKKAIDILKKKGEDKNDKRN